MPGEVGFETLCKFASGQHDASATDLAFQPNISAQTDNRPFIGTAWMLFAQAQVIVELQVGKHRGKPGSLDRIDDEDYILNYDKLRTKKSTRKRVCTVQTPEDLCRNVKRTRSKLPV